MDISRMDTAGSDGTAERQHVTPKSPVRTVKSAAELSKESNQEDHSKTSLKQRDEGRKSRGIFVGDSEDSEEDFEESDSVDDFAPDVNNPKKRARSLVPEAERKRRKPAHRNPNVKVGGHGDEIGMTDQIMIDQRDSGAKWSQINPLFQNLNSLPHVPATSTLPSRYRKIQTKTHNFTEEEDATFLDLKTQLEARWDRAKWSFLSIGFMGIMGKRYGKHDVYPFDAKSLKRRYSELVPLTFEQESDKEKPNEQAATVRKERLSSKTKNGGNTFSPDSAPAPPSTPSRSTRNQVRIATAEAEADTAATADHNAQVSRSESCDDAIMEALDAYDHMSDGGGDRDDEVEESEDDKADSA